MELLITLFVLLEINLVTLEAKSLNNGKSVYDENVLSRNRRYLGLSKKFKLNKRYQECVASGDIQGHCKHAIFCPNAVGSSINSLDSLCVIEKTHVGVCCPDDVLLSKIQGSHIITDLPASGLDYENDNHKTGCGLRIMAKSKESYSPVQKWPWIAALYRPEDPYVQFCGGALITDQHILTAAHCINGLNLKDIRVRLGEYDFTRLKETRSKDFSLANMIMHEDYDHNTYENDIAILKLNKPTTFNSYIWPICLPPVNRSFENETVIVAGWGQVYYGGPLSERLLEISIPVWEMKKCVESMALKVPEHSICAAGYEGNLDSCKGDSGGPLLYLLENGRWVTVGVVSWGIKCGVKGIPGIYTSVNKYIPWIVTNTLLK